MWAGNRGNHREEATPMKPLRVLIYLVLAIAFFSVVLSNAKRSQDAASRATRSFLASVVVTFL